MMYQETKPGIAELFFSVEGRVNRSTFWLRFVVPIWVVSILIAIVDGFITGGIIYAIWAIFTIWPTIVVYAKRWHDRDKSGWWTLIALIPVIGAIWLFVELGLLRGTIGNNRFGPEPQ